MKAFRSLLALAALGSLTLPAPAHYNMLLPDKHAVQKGDTVDFLYQWGHPFEHQLFDAPAPESVVVVAPDGKATTYPGKFAQATKVAVGDKKVTAFRFSYKPDQRGDYRFVLKTPPIWMDEEQEFYQDTVKVVLHVQAQKGWDLPAGKGFELLPLTRPYGLLPGMVFQAEVQQGSRPKKMPEGEPPLPMQEIPRPVAKGSLVEIERYNPVSPKELPVDEFITRTVRADANGVATTTLTESGWWCLTAQRDSGLLMAHNDKRCPVRERTTLWVYVDEKAAAKK
jgi:cobalt/nickel transport protein